MSISFIRALALLVPAAILSPNALAQNVRFHTNLGDIDVALLPDSAPKTVSNFLNYVNKSAFTNSIFHRSVMINGTTPFIIQGGGYVTQNGTPVAIPQDPPVQNEFVKSSGSVNVRGTIAMAKLGNDPNSATNQWFFNLGNNSANLDNQNGGFTVFGRITTNAGLLVMDKIAAVPAFNRLGFDQIPLQNYKGGTPDDSNFIIVLSITQLGPPPAITSGGVITAGSFGGIAAAAPGSFIEIYGSNLAGTSRVWDIPDFTNGNAPTILDGVSVTVGGRPAYVYYVSPNQVNVQVPATVVAGTLASVVVSYKGQSSPSASIAINPVAGGILAPPGFNVDGKQYAAAVHAVGGGFVSSGNIPGVPASPAIPGETITFYGTGFGAVNPSGTAFAGQVAQGLTSVVANVRFSIGPSTAPVTYAGLAPGLVGLYQFNVTVPPDASNGDLPVTVTIDGDAIQQSLLISVQGKN